MPSEDAAAALALDRGNALLLVIDVQERLATAMPPAPLARLKKNAEVLIRAARRLAMPVVATEQYPKGLGPTVSSLRELLPADPMTKMEFSCGASRPIAREILGTGRRQAMTLLERSNRLPSVLTIPAIGFRADESEHLLDATHDLTYRPVAEE